MLRMILILFGFENGDTKINNLLWTEGFSSHSQSDFQFVSSQFMPYLMSLLKVLQSKRISIIPCSV